MGSKVGRLNKEVVPLVLINQQQSEPNGSLCKPHDLDPIYMDSFHYYNFGYGISSSWHLPAAHSASARNVGR